MEEDEDDEETRNRLSRRLFGMAANEVRTILNDGLMRNRNEKLGIIRDLTANLADGKAKARYQRQLHAKDLPELRDLHHLFRLQTNGRRMTANTDTDDLIIGGDRRVMNFLGAGVPVPLNNSAVSQDYLDMVPPTINYAELVEEQKVGR
jgi:hypothetical protein